MKSKLPSSSQKQDITGHVTFDHSQSQAIREFHDKINRIGLLKQHGLIQYKPERNVLLAEKTPRNADSNRPFNPFPPPPIPGIGILTAADKWIVPEKDNGLVSKFESQKEYYDKINQFDKQIEEAKRRKQLLKQDMESQCSIQTNRTPETPSSTVSQQPILSSTSQPSHRENAVLSDRREYSYALRANPYGGTDLLTSLYPSSSLPQSSLPQSKTWKDHRIQVLREVGSKHPEILQEYRAQRAAAFVNKHILSSSTNQNTLTNSKPNSKDDQYHNNSNNNINNHTNRENSIQNDDSSNSNVISFLSPKVAKEQLHLLIEELSKTEEAIERQELKIGLNNRRKHYEKPTAATLLSSVSVRSSAMNTKTAIK